MCDLSVSKHFKNSFSRSKTNNVFMTDRSVIADQLVYKFNAFAVGARAPVLFHRGDIRSDSGLCSRVKKTTVKPRKGT